MNEALIAATTQDARKMLHKSGLSQMEQLIVLDACMFSIRMEAWELSKRFLKG